MRTPISWFEIPVQDFDRARSFYEKLFGAPLTIGAFGPSQMGVFPYNREAETGGCIMSSEGWASSQDGSVVYLNTGVPLDEAVGRAIAAGATVLVPRTEVPGVGFFAHIRDTEGNRVGLAAVN